jgi:hypothetical protein
MTEHIAEIDYRPQQGPQQQTQGPELQHNEPQTKYLIEISPKGKYLIICSDSKDCKKFIGWNVGIDEGGIQVGEYIYKERDDKQEDGEKKSAQDDEIKQDELGGDKKTGVQKDSKLESIREGKNKLEGIELEGGKQENSIQDGEKESVKGGGEKESSIQEDGEKESVKGDGEKKNSIQEDGEQVNVVEHDNIHVERCCSERIHHMCVSDEKILTYINDDYDIGKCNYYFANLFKL